MDRLSPAAGGIRPDEHALLLNGGRNKTCSVERGRRLRSLQVQGAVPAERVSDVPVGNYHLLVRPDIIKNARQPEHVIFARFHEGVGSIAGLQRFCGVQMLLQRIYLAGSIFSGSILTF